jgi:hypothetical protein
VTTFFGENAYIVRKKYHDGNIEDYYTERDVLNTITTNCLGLGFPEVIIESKT